MRTNMMPGNFSAGATLCYPKLVSAGNSVTRASANLHSHPSPGPAAAATARRGYGSYSPAIQVTVEGNCGATKIIDGRPVAQRIQGEIKQAVEELRAKTGAAPCLGVVLVGDDPASAMYVRMKRRACERSGLRSEAQSCPSASTQAEVEDAVRAFNADPGIHGILVQLPLPDHIDEESVLNEISLAKDVDGIHPMNLGRLGMRGREPTFTPRRPLGVMQLIAERAKPSRACARSSSAAAISSGCRWR